MESTGSTLPIKDQPQRILFFDGYCVLCNRWVDFLLRVLRTQMRDSTHLAFHFASLQGETAKKLLGEIPLRSVILYECIPHEKGVIFLTESDAILRIFSLLGKPWKLFRVFLLIPRFFRNWIYRMIANHRYQWFGKKDQCRLPTLEEQQYFLD